MDPQPQFRTIVLSVFTTLFALLVVGAWLFSASSGLSQAPDGPTGSAHLASTPAAGSGDGASVAAAPLLPASLGGDGGASARFPLEPLDVAGPDSPQAPDETFSYYRLVGTAFNPRTSVTTFEYNFNGCIYETAGSDNRFMAPLLVPDGSVLKYLRLYYNDTSAATDLTAWITRYQPGVTSEDLTAITSTGSSGYGTTLSQEITHTVNLNSWAYTLIVAPNANAATNSLCGIRVAYYAPFFGATALPVIMK